MKWIVMMLPLMLAGCAQSQQPDAPPPPNSIGMAKSGCRLLRPEGR